MLAVARAVSEPSTNAALYGLVGVLVGTAISAIANYAIAWGIAEPRRKSLRCTRCKIGHLSYEMSFERGERKRSTPESQPTDSTGLLSALRS